MSQAASATPASATPAPPSPAPEAPALAVLAPTAPAPTRPAPSGPAPTRPTPAGPVPTRSIPAGAAPTQSTPTGPAPTRPTPTGGSATEPVDSFRILSPLDGDVYHPLVGVPHRYATLGLRAAGGEGRGIRWFVDGRAQRTARWPIVPGAHRIRAVDGAGTVREVRVMVE
ncbi:MAG TPA: hypothetical protein VHR43_17060 [Gemmatimonadales bacterium]|nr:hypothetical protein [Gemmatimonadales bacterium]